VVLSVSVSFWAGRFLAGAVTGKGTMMRGRLLVCAFIAAQYASPGRGSVPKGTPGLETVAVTVPLAAAVVTPPVPSSRYAECFPVGEETSYGKPNQGDRQRDGALPGSESGVHAMVRAAAITTTHRLAARQCSTRPAVCHPTGAVRRVVDHGWRLPLKKTE
jgi:hypothetical protein